MDPLKKKFEEKALALFKEYRSILKEHGDKKADEVKLSQIFGGMRGVKSMIWETSNLDATEGIKFRGFSIPQLQEKLPTRYNCDQPLPEGLFWLMLTGELPTNEEVKWLTDEWEKRGEVPQHTTDLINSLPDHMHPMAMFSSAIISMSTESIFAQKYAEGMSKTEYWDATYEDAMNLIAKLPRVAAHIYRKLFHNNEVIGPDNR